MRKNIIVALILLSFFPLIGYSQGNNCASASPFCTASGAATFPASQNTTAPSGPNYGCLFSQPNPAWFYLQIATAGNVVLNMTNSANVDIDFVLWGPFTSSSAACASGLTSTPVSCSYSSSSNETGTINGAVVGEVYVLLITNYSNQVTNISLAQTGGTGATSCSIVCVMDSLNVTAGVCVSPTNIFDLSGTLKYNSPPGAGTLTISTSCSSATQVFNAPFNPDSVIFTLAGLPADGSSCTVTAEFSNDPNCTITKTFVAPPPCFVDCPIQVDSVRTCDGVAAQLTATGANSYVWSTGETTSSILISGVPATYTVIGITGTCADTATALVTTYPPPTVAFTADTLAGCNQLRVHFTADTTGNAGAIYTWNYGQNNATGSGDTVSHLFEAPGCYTVSLNASFGPGCSNIDSIACMIHVHAPPVASFSFSPEDIDIIASTAYFSNTSSNSIAWLWSFGDSTASTEQSPEHTYDSVGDYTVSLYAINSFGCIDSMSTILRVKDIITFYVPNAFTPNKNGINEIFNMAAFGVMETPFEMRIFDRWGKQVFKTNDINEGWNGAFNNNGPSLPEDLYVYKIAYKEVTGKQRNIIGKVALMK